MDQTDQLHPEIKPLETYSTSTREREDVPEQFLDQAVMQGTHSFPANQRINVVDKNGESFNVPSTQVKDAIAAGYQIERPRAQAIREYVEQNSGLGGAAKVALGKFGDEAAMGIPGIIFEKKGDPFEVAKWEALKNEHEAAKVLGSVGGFGASLLVGGPLFKGAEVAGKGAAEVAAKQLSALGLEKGSKSIAKEIVARSAEKAVQYGVEGAVVSAPRAITEAMLGDPEQAGETMLWGAGIGGALGAASGPFSKAIESLNSKARSILEKDSIAAEKAQFGKPVSMSASDAAKAESEASKVETVLGAPAEADNANMEKTPENLLEAAQQSGADEKTISQLIKESQSLRPDAPEIMDALNRRKLPVMEGQVSNSKFVQDLHGTLLERPTFAGQAEARKLGEVYKGTQEALHESFEHITPYTKEEVGNQIGESISNKIDENMSKFHDIYENQIRSSTKNIPITPEEISGIGKGTLTLQEQRLFPKLVQMRDELVDQFSNIKNLDDLKRMRTTLNERIRGMNMGVKMGTVEKDQLNLYQAFKEKLTDFEQRKIVESAIANAPNKAEGMKIGEELSSLIKNTNKEYADMMRELGDFTKGAKLGRNLSPSGIADKLAETSGNKIVDKLFDKKNVKFLNFMKERFPPEFEQLLAVKRKELLGDAVENSQIMTHKIAPGKVIREFKKYEPEVQKLLLGGKEQSFKDAEVIHRTMIKDPNPSGTAHTLQYHNLFSPSGLADAAFGNLADAAKMKFIKASTPVEGVLAAEQVMKHAGSKLDQIPEMMKKLASASPVKVSDVRIDTIDAVNRMFGEKSYDDKMSKAEKLQYLKDQTVKFVSNPSLLQDTIAKQTQGVHSLGAPQIAQAMQMKMQTAVNYMYQSMPKSWVAENPYNPQPFTPSDADISKFERKLSVIIDPFSAIDELHDGTLTKDHIEALMNVYPKLYDTMKGRIFQQVLDNKPKISFQNRMKLSLFMGGGIDPAIQAPAMADFQAFYQKQNQPQESTGAGLGKINFAQSTQTDTEKRAST